MSQIARWRGEFGNEYTQRNALTPELLESTRKAWGHLLGYIEEPTSILECGANVGRNLRALSELTTAKLVGVEPNPLAREQLAGSFPAYDADLSHLPFPDASFDLVFTSGVLIHVPDEALVTAYDEMYRVCRRYLLCMEYFSPESEHVHYRGYDDLLWKRDYGALWLDRFPMRYIADGFFWKRSTGLDNLNWWLFEKPYSSSILSDPSVCPTT